MLLRYSRMCPSWAIPTWPLLFKISKPLVKAPCSIGDKFRSHVKLRSDKKRDDCLNVRTVEFTSREVMSSSNTCKCIQPDCRYSVASNMVNHYPQCINFSSSVQCDQHIRSTRNGRSCTPSYPFRLLRVRFQLLGYRIQSSGPPRF